MKIVVIGGSGLNGSQTVAILRQGGHGRCRLAQYRSQQKVAGGRRCNRF